MTQSPSSGQTAPHNAGFGPVTTTQASRSTTEQERGGSGTWAPPGAPSGSGRPGASESATTALPHVPQSGSVPPPASTPSGAGPQRAADTAAKARAPRTRGPRRARLQLRHINPWTVLKFSCVLSVALFFVWLITIGVLYGILDGAGIIGKINDTVTTLQGGNATDPVTAGVVFGSAAIIGVINMVLFVALSTIGSLVYNLCADLVGGIEITLSER